MVSAEPRQYAHRQPSRAKIARRDMPTWVRYGTRTYECSRITDGTATDRVAEWNAEGRRVLVYFNNDLGGHAIHNARKLKELLSARVG